LIDGDPDLIQDAIFKSGIRWLSMLPDNSARHRCSRSRNPNEGGQRQALGGSASPLRLIVFDHSVRGGLAKVASNVALKRAHKSDFCDRPQYRGEIDLDALRKFLEDPSAPTVAEFVDEPSALAGSNKDNEEYRRNQHSAAEPGGISGILDAQRPRQGQPQEP
jgi:hypothetical protein